MEYGLTSFDGRLLPPEFLSTLTHITPRGKQISIARQPPESQGTAAGTNALDEYHDAHP